MRGAAEGPRCGATALGTVGHYFPRLVEEALGVKFNLVIGYPGAAEIDLAIQKNEVQCRAGSLEGYFGSEPSKSWAKSGFARVLINGGAKRDARIADVATLHEIDGQTQCAGCDAPIGDGVAFAGLHRPTVGDDAGRAGGPGEALARCLQ